MSADSLVAVIGLFLGFYAIAPRWLQLDLNLRRGRRHLALVFVALLAVYYLLLFPIFLAAGLSPKLGLYRWNVSLLNIADLPKSIPQANAVNNAGFLAANQRQIMKFSPWHRATQDEDSQKARDILSSILLSDAAVRSLVKRSPHLGIRLLRIDLNPVFDFSKSYIQGMIESPGSYWYRELRASDNASNRYDIEPNGVLEFLLGDIQTASRLRVYGTVGDWVVNELNRRARLAEDDFNWAIDDFDRVDKWSSPVWTSIRFFDIMILEGIWQDFRGHLWMYYMTSFVRCIVRNCRFDRDPLVIIKSVYPTRYCYLLSEIVRNVLKWISQINDLPTGQTNTLLKMKPDCFENENPVKSAIFVLAQCVLLIATAGSVLPPDFRRDLFQEIVRCYFELPSSEHCVPYKRIFVQLLSQGGPTKWKDNERRKVAVHILDALESMDQVRLDKADLEAFRSRFSCSNGSKTQIGGRKTRMGSVRK